MPLGTWGFRKNGLVPDFPFVAQGRLALDAVTYDSSELDPKMGCLGFASSQTALLCTELPLLYPLCLSIR